MTVKVEMRALSMAFGGLLAVENLHMVINEGELLGLIGPNGAGKTTVINLLTGVYKPTRGEILYNGQALQRKAAHQVVRLGIARTFQNIRLFSTLSVLENVMVGQAIRVQENPLQAVLLNRGVRRRRAEWVEVAQELLDYVGLSAAADELATSLPYGKQRLVEIARALATGCEVLLLDEPAAGMNLAEKRELMRLISDIRTEQQKTILLIEHDMKLLMNLVDRVVVLDHGKVIAQGLPAEVQANPQVIEAYLGGMEVTA